MTPPRTLGDFRCGMCLSGYQREPACPDSAPLWDAIGLPGDTPIEVLLERWTPLAACLLAIADGRLRQWPPVQAVSWVEDGLGTAILVGADLRGADLRGAVLAGAYLEGADLRGANLEGAYLRDADFDRADLRGANISGTDLRGASFIGAQPPDGWELRGWTLEYVGGES